MQQKVNQGAMVNQKRNIYILVQYEKCEIIHHIPMIQ